MISDISPYALLRTSKPNRSPTLVTPYDLYSVVQMPYASASYTHEDNKAGNTLSHEQPSFPVPRLIPSAKTHYIQDIRKRHDHALHRSQKHGAIVDKQVIRRS